MNTNTDIDTSIDTGDEFEDLTPEEIALIHEDSLVGRAYDDHQDWKDEESLREFCAPYVTWASQEQHDSATAVSDYLRALIGDDRD